MRRRSIARARLALGFVMFALSVAVAAPASAAPLVCNGDASLCDRTLDRVVMPATHNSMSNALDGWAIPNQQLGIPWQLALGVRGLLIDTYYAHRDANGQLVTDSAKTPTNQLYLCHVLCSIGATPLIDSLRGITTFLEKNPHNVLVIVNEDYTQPVDFIDAVRRSGLRRHVYRGQLGPRWPTLRKLIQQRRQVVLTTQGDGGPFPWYREAYQGLVQETPYDWPSPDLITKPANWQSSCRPLRGGTTAGLFLMNHWSPPVAPSPSGSAVVNAADTIVGRANVCRFIRGRWPTLIAVDMFQSGGLFEAVRRLNAAIGR